MIDNETITEAIQTVEEEIVKIKGMMHEIAMEEENIEPLLRPGRFVKNREFCWPIGLPGLARIVK